MKLELKHLAPYLPYGLNLWHENNQRKYPLVVGNNTMSIRGGLRIDEFEAEGCKPILRPLSDLTKEIEVNGERFVPFEELGGSLNGDEDEPLYVQHIHKCSTGLVFPKYLPHWVVENLFRWHFDVFGLIEQGLAININEL